MVHGRIKVKKIKVGTWKKRIAFRAYADNEYVGQFDTMRDAVSAADAKCQANDELIKEYKPDLLEDE